MPNSSDNCTTHQMTAQLIRQLPNSSDNCPTHQTTAQLIRQLHNSSDNCPTHRATAQLIGQLPYSTSYCPTLWATANSLGNCLTTECPDRFTDTEYVVLLPLSTRHLHKFSYTNLAFIHQATFAYWPEPSLINTSQEASRYHFREHQETTVDGTTEAIHYAD